MFKQADSLLNYRIKTGSDTTGLSTHVIRKWEERYHSVHPRRGPNGSRLFKEDDYYRMCARRFS